MEAPVVTPGNRLLAHLSLEDLDRLRPDLTPVDLRVRQRLSTANALIEHVYFLDEGIASVVTRARDTPPIEIGIIGREGATNLSVVLGADRSPNDTFMQIAGRGHRIPANKLCAAAAEGATLDHALRRFVHVFMVQATTTALANGHANIGERLARWLLMAHDRVDGDDLALTHEFLSVMLGVRRSSVTVALREFERSGLIVRGRRKVTVSDAEGLREAAGGFYGAAEGEFDRLFGESGSR